MIVYCFVLGFSNKREKFGKCCEWDTTQKDITSLNGTFLGIVIIPKDTIRMHSRAICYNYT